ncbi:hypothetical protein GH714_011267 [Hevea brasiliensis]|uniref:Reverse transcriptase zinc-binding domain-containing protein n=1 Tax=Hevea brasiliensis TaxID=3981 RepID=A0A6A6M7W1_HEVBR|nr:hypothetical protein GH714_011267 [Hevea brasiliensis]
MMRGRGFWHFNKNGIYSVKSAYHVLSEDHLISFGQLGGLNWKKLWLVPVPPKVKNLVRRALHNIIPTVANLQTRKVYIGGGCLKCSAFEDADHGFLTCPCAYDCWESFGFGEVDQFASLSSFVAFILALSDKQPIARSFMILWGLWVKRNQLVWQGKSCTGQDVVDMALSCLADWEASQSCYQQYVSPVSRMSIVDHWFPPPMSFYKCNIDAGIFELEKKFSYAAVVRDSSGNFQATFSGFQDGVVLPKLAEA